MKKSVILIILLFIAVQLFAQYIPPNGTEDIFNYYSPVFLSGGAAVTSAESPLADSLNPAVAGNKQRTIIDMNYIGLAGIGSESGWGNIINSGITLPTRYGVFSGALHFLQSPFAGINMGVLGGLDLSFSKDLLPELLVGAGLSFRAGAGEIGDWGLGLSLGILGFLDNVWIFKDFKYGIAIKDMGKGYKPVAGRSSFPPIFTPSVSTDFSVLNNDLFSVRFSTDITLPSFQDFRFMLGAEIGYKDFIFLRSAYQFDLMELISNDLSGRTFPVSFGGTVKIKTSIKDNISFLGISEKGWNRSEININFSAAPLQNGTWGFGLGVNIPLGVIDKTPPSISLGSKDLEYISPNLDGVLDNLVVPLTITDERYIKGYNFIILDSGGSKVRTIVNKDVRPENLTFKNMMDRLLYVKKGITVPEKLVWNGKSGNGKVAADGNYTYYVEAWDDNGNIGKSGIKRVVVDNTKPSVKVVSTYLVFSPNGDGSKDTLIINQDGTKEDLWQAFIKDTEGNQVRKFSWKNEKPPGLMWDGKNDDGILAKDGVYNYRITSTDRAGNTGSGSLKNIIINTQATPININIDKSYFSPDNDKIKDTINFNLNVPITSGIEKWNLVVKDSSGKAARTFSGKQGIPAIITFDGKNNKGDILPEGKYSAELHVNYINGNNPNAVSPDFYIDITKPVVSLKSDTNIFSPNGDGNKDTVTIFQETSEELNWKGIIKNNNGEIVKSFFWRGKADFKISWDGRNDKGMLVPDGSYTYQLETTDRAGNYGKSNIISMVLNTQETPVFLSTDLLYFSPNSDGSKDSIRIIPHLKVETGIENYNLTIKDKDGISVREYSGRKSVPKDFVWDGLDKNSNRVKEGKYYAEINILYSNGNNPGAKTQLFTIDNTFPVVKVSVSQKIFSPDNDGNLDALAFNQKSSREDLWDGTVLNGKGKIVKSYFWKGNAVSFSWDGRDENGNKLPDGTYTYRVQSTDKAGNKTTEEIRNIVIDTRPTTVFITVQARGLSPNGDGYMDNISFKLYISLAEGISSWNLKMINDNGKAEKVFKGSTKILPVIVWDGRNSSGKVTEGTYTGELTVNYTKGNRPNAKTNSFRVDISPPQVDLNISPELFSPDNDGVNDELYLNLKVNDLSPISSWTINILDPMGNLFSSFGGRGVPSDKIVWNGISDTGELVQAAEDYSLVFTIKDDLGNVRTAKRIIPVDVLVIREGNKLKIRISSITFAPNKPDFITIDKTKAEKNKKTLERLAEILKKYRRYNIRIEGHAVNLSWYDPKKAEKEEKEELIPLSLDRAKAVKKALVELGINANRITTAGLGGSQPVVPFSDRENRWKDRRVEFILIRK